MTRTIRLEQAEFSAIYDCLACDLTLYVDGRPHLLFPRVAVSAVEYARDESNLSSLVSALLVSGAPRAEHIAMIGIEDLSEAFAIL